MKSMQANSWSHRRRIIYASLLFCAGAVSYLLIYGEDTRLNETLANGFIMLAGSTLGSYVFGAAWDDRNKARGEEKNDY